MSCVWTWPNEKCSNSFMWCFLSNARSFLRHVLELHNVERFEITSPLYHQKHQVYDKLAQCQWFRTKLAELCWFGYIFSRVNLVGLKVSPISRGKKRLVWIERRIAYLPYFCVRVSPIYKLPPARSPKSKGIVSKCEKPRMVACWSFTIPETRPEQYRNRTGVRCTGGSGACAGIGSSVINNSSLNNSTKIECKLIHFGLINLTHG